MPFRPQVFTGALVGAPRGGRPVVAGLGGNGPVRTANGAGRRRPGVGHDHLEEASLGGSREGRPLQGDGHDPGPAEEVRRTSGSARSAVLTGLVAGLTYSFTVQAHNARGWSKASKAVTAVPTSTPTPPPPPATAAPRRLRDHLGSVRRRRTSAGLGVTHAARQRLRLRDQPLRRVRPAAADRRHPGDLQRRQPGWQHPRERDVRLRDPRPVRRAPRSSRPRARSSTTTRAARRPICSSRSGPARSASASCEPPAFPSTRRTRREQPTRSWPESSTTSS